MAVKSKGTVGVIGLGIMGGAFAQNLIAAGWRVVGYDIAPARRRALARAGVEIAASAADVARKVSTIITSLPSPKALDVTARTIVAAKVPRRVVIEASTFTIEDKAKAERVLRKAGHVLLDCPVSGTGAQAKNKDIVVYASGGAAEIKRARPLFAAFTRAVTDLGEFGNGSKMKYVANLLVAIHNVASAEAMVLGMKAGLPPQLIYDLVKSGAGNSRVFELRGPMMVKGRYGDPIDEDIGVAKGHGRHRRLRPQDSRADADVRRQQAGLSQGPQERLRRRRYGGSVRGDGEDGRREARQDESEAASAAIGKGLSGGKRRNFLDLTCKLSFGDGQVVGTLQIDPKIGTVAKKLAKTQSHPRRHGLLFVENVVERLPRDTKQPCDLGLRLAERRQNIGPKHLARMHRLQATEQTISTHQ